MKNITIIALMLSVAFGCKKKDDSSTPADTSTTTTTGGSGSTPTTSLTINSGAQIQFSLDGTSLSYVEALSPFVLNGQANVVASPSYTVGTTYFNSSGTVIEISKGRFTILSGTGSNADTQFNNFFPKATVPYSVGSTNGMSITWYDASGNLWSTDNGNQTGSVFTIVDKATDYVRDSNGYLSMKVYATFNCKVYNTSGGVKTITNGKFVGYYSYQ